MPKEVLCANRNTSEWWEPRVSSFSRIVGLGKQHCISKQPNRFQHLLQHLLPPFASRSPGMLTGKSIPSVSAPAPNWGSRFIDGGGSGCSRGGEGNRWTDFSPVAFACELGRLPRGRALKTRCGSTRCHSGNVCHTSQLIPPSLVFMASPTARKPQACCDGCARAGGMQIARCPL